MLTKKFLSVDDMKANGDVLAKLFRISFEASFKDVVFSEEFILQKVNQCMDFVNLGDAIVIGVFEENNLVGFVYFYEKDVFGKKAIHLNHIAVLPSMQGQGVGSMLLYEMERSAAKKGVSQIDLDVTISNSALNLYKKFGYVEERVVMAKKVKGGG